METIKNALFGSGGLLKVRALLAFTLVGSSAYMWVNGDSPPAEMLTLTGGVAGYYFATRAKE